MAVAYRHKFRKSASEISIDVFDLVHIAAIDYEVIAAAVRRNGKAIVVAIYTDRWHWRWNSCLDCRTLLEHLGAPIMRRASLDNTGSV